ncbi:NAD(P)-dependent dehydrogenase (short-subunit alcohol dehydrogenase family) [Catenulispora sp. GP43]|uniref:SDR family NAD(P)-dependent oxidoreductase n=1 Tax=Catenulispora sp. GP43 TaxID=3156263 RepID=UPI003512ADC2
MTEQGSVLILGAGPGLGLAVARVFAEAGHAVALLGRGESRLRELAAVLQGGGHRVHVQPADAARPQDLQAALDAAIAELGAPEVLVYNAAAARPDTPTGAAAATAEHWADSLAVNVTGAAVAAGHVIPAFREGRGTVLLTGGGFAVAPSPDYTTLSVGKAALRAYALALHAEQLKAGVHVSTVTIRGLLRPDDARFAPAAIAPVYLELHRQPRDQWQAEYIYP